MGLYAAIAGEVPTDRIARDLLRRGSALVYPRVRGETLLLHSVSDPDLLESGYRNLREPSADAPVIPATDVDLFVVPGLLFDRHGYRLGRGGGHYDRLLAGASPRACVIGLCYADRIVGRLPREPWDRRVHWLVTQEQVLRVGEAQQSDGDRA